MKVAVLIYAEELLKAYNSSDLALNVKLGLSNIFHRSWLGFFIFFLPNQSLFSFWILFFQ